VAGVVVGLDRVPRSGPALRRPALEWAAHEAHRRGLPLTLLHAWDLPVDLSVDARDDELLALVAAGTPVTARAVHGAAGAVLLAQQADLLVLGGALGRPGVGHVVRACLRRATCPVVVVPSTPAAVAHPATTARVVVGVCGTAASHAAVRWAAAEAACRGAELVLVHAWQAFPASVSEVLRPAQGAAARALAASRRLNGWAEAAGWTPGDVVLRPERGAPLDVLVARSGEADLVVLGRSDGSRGGLLHEALGEDVAGLALCPVALVPAGFSPSLGAR
jgi:nucleotide-binding universal stress UspA family protein